MDRLSLQLMLSSWAGKKARPLSLSTTTRPWLAQDWEKREVCTGGRGEDKREWKGNGRGEVEWEGRKEVVQVNFIPPHLSSLLSTLSPTVRGWGDRRSRDNGMGEEKRREDTSVGMEEHSSHQSLSCLLPQHTHTSPCPVGVQVSGAALKDLTAFAKW